MKETNRPAQANNNLTVCKKENLIKQTNIF